MSDWFATLPGLCARAWDVLRAAVASPDHPMHRVALATALPGGGAAVRTLVLRGSDAGAGVLEMQTDLASAKVAELRADPGAEVMAWVPQDALQLRARGSVEVVTGPEIAARWDSMDEVARLNYGGAPAPGMPLDDPMRYRNFGDRGRFAVLRLTVARLEAVHLGAEPHRRAVFLRDDGFAGRWVGP